MAFDFHLHIPETSRSGQVIQMLAEERHITPEQAAERLLEEAAQLHAPVKTHQVKVSPEYLRQLKTRSAARAEARRVNGDPMAASRPETPDALIGYLADVPEVAQTIRDMAYERRASSYGI
jgi:hypothetical protein